MASVQQLIYTSCNHGINSATGYQVYTKSRNCMISDIKIKEHATYERCDAIVKIDSIVEQSRLAPLKYVYTFDQDQTYLISSKLAEKDYYTLGNRPGNYVSHYLSMPKNIFQDVYAIDLFDADFWKKSLTDEECNQHPTYMGELDDQELSLKAKNAYVFSMNTLRNRLLSIKNSDKVDILASMLYSLHHENNKKIIIKTSVDSHTESIELLSLLLKLISPEYTKDKSFSTYCQSVHYDINIFVDLRISDSPNYRFFEFEHSEFKKSFKCLNAQSHEYQFYKFLLNMLIDDMYSFEQFRDQWVNGLKKSTFTMKDSKFYSMMRLFYETNFDEKSFRSILTDINQFKGLSQVCLKDCLVKISAIIERYQLDDQLNADLLKLRIGVADQFDEGQFDQLTNDLFDFMNTHVDRYRSIFPKFDFFYEKCLNRLPSKRRQIDQKSIDFLKKNLNRIDVILFKDICLAFNEQSELFQSIYLDISHTIENIDRNQTIKNSLNVALLESYIDQLLVYSLEGHRYFDDFLNILIKQLLIALYHQSDSPNEMNGIFKKVLSYLPRNPRLKSALITQFFFTNNSNDSYSVFFKLMNAINQVNENRASFLIFHEIFDQIYQKSSNEINLSQNLINDLYIIYTDPKLDLYIDLDRSIKFLNLLYDSYFKKSATLANITDAIVSFYASVSRLFSSQHPSNQVLGLQVIEALYLCKDRDSKPLSVIFKQNKVKDRELQAKIAKMALALSKNVKFLLRVSLILDNKDPQMINNIKQQLNIMDTEKRIDLLFETKQVKDFLDVDDYGLLDYVAILTKFYRLKNLQLDSNVIKDIWIRLGLLLTVWSVVLVVMVVIGFYSYSHVSKFVSGFFISSDTNNDVSKKDETTSSSTGVYDLQKNEVLNDVVGYFSKEYPTTPLNCKAAKDDQHCADLILPKIQEKVIEKCSELKTKIQEIADISMIADNEIIDLGKFSCGDDVKSADEIKSSDLLQKNILQIIHSQIEKIEDLANYNQEFKLKCSKSDFKECIEKEIKGKIKKGIEGKCVQWKSKIESNKEFFIGPSTKKLYARWEKHFAQKTKFCHETETEIPNLKEFLENSPLMYFTDLKNHANDHFKTSPYATCISMVDLINGHFGLKIPADIQCE